MKKVQERSLILHIIALLILSNILRCTINVNEMNRCGEQFKMDDLMNDKQLRRIVGELGDYFGVMMLNTHALNITFNWLCNTASMENVHNRTLFFTVDKHAYDVLSEAYPRLHIFLWNTPCLQRRFETLDATYMSFFLLRTTLIRALLGMKRSFWMIQADTIWRKNVYVAHDWSAINANVLLDQQGYDGSREARKKQMNGANFLVKYSHRTEQLFENLYWYQSHFYIADPDAIKIPCSQTDVYDCRFIDHSIITGWEWIYGDQSNAPLLMQMDGETNGNKEKTLENYKLWFLDEHSKCVTQKVLTAKQLLMSGKIPRLLSSSKLRQQFLLLLGEALGDLPIFGSFYRVYGGIPSIYLQFF